MNQDCFVYHGGLYCRVQEPSYTYVRVGVLLNDRLGPLPLYGRRTDPRSPDWFYYTESATDPPQTLPVFNKRGKSCRQTSFYSRGCGEVDDGDEMTVQGYPNEVFRVSLFQT
jgi:hypothetical protein